MMITPTTIPEKRGKGAEIAVAVVAILFFIIGVWCSDSNNKFHVLGLTITIYPMVIMITQLVLRTCLIFEEIWHRHSRYSSWVQIVVHAFTFSKGFIVAFVLLLFPLFYICLTHGFPPKLLPELGYSTIFCLIGALLFIRLLKPDAGPLCQAITINNLNGLDYGSGMACSFFYGYLQLILPNRGTEQKGLREVMRDFEAQEHITFYYDRLLVLVPLSLQCPATIEQDDNSVELAKSLPDIKISRAGVSNRSYKNTAYKIKMNNGEKAYVCLEYATPLRTLLETISHRSEYANDYAIQRKELVLQFYLTAQSLIDNDPDCKDGCDLIFFDDRKGVDVGQVVLDHIEKHKKKNRHRRDLDLEDNEKGFLINNVGT